MESLENHGETIEKIHRHRPQIACPKKQSPFFHIHKAAAFVLRIHKRSLTIDSSGSEGKSSSKEKPEGRQAWKRRRQKGNHEGRQSLGDKAAAAAKGKS